MRLFGEDVIARIQSYFTGDRIRRCIDLIRNAAKAQDLTTAFNMSCSVADPRAELSKGK